MVAEAKDCCSHSCHEEKPCHAECQIHIDRDRNHSAVHAGAGIFQQKWSFEFDSNVRLAGASTTEGSTPSRPRDVCSRSNMPLRPSRYDTFQIFGVDFYEIIGVAHRFVATLQARADLHLAAQLGSTAIGIQTSEGVVLAVEKRVTSPLLDPASIEKIMELDTHIGCAMSGLTADARTLVDKARVETQNHRFTYDEAMTVESCTQAICDYALQFGEEGAPM